MRFFSLLFYDDDDDDGDDDDDDDDVLHVMHGRTNCACAERRLSVKFSCSNAHCSLLRNAMTSP